MTHDDMSAGDPDIGAALEAFCLTQAASASAWLKHTKHPHKGVHEARKAIRRIRSVVALGKGTFSSASLTVDTTLKKLGRSLSRLRDAHVVTELARERVRATEEPPAAAAWQRIVDRLRQRRTHVLDSETSRDPEFRERIRRLDEVCQAIQKLPWTDLDTVRIASEVEARKWRADRAGDHCKKRTTIANQHRWRRRLRRYRMQLSALSSVSDEPALSAPDRVRDDLQATYARSSLRKLPLGEQIDLLGATLDVELLRKAIRRLPPSLDRKWVLSQLREHRKRYDRQKVVPDTDIKDF